MKRKLDELIRYMDSEEAKARLWDIYEDESKIDAQQERYKEAIRQFQTLYGDRTVEIYSAPGRSEVGGNHTDHQLGKVLATSINKDIIAVVAPTDDNKIVWKSAGYPQIELSLTDLSVCEAEKESTAALIRGVAAGVKNAGYEIGGFLCYATSEVLSGSGLSSSASFEVAVGNVLSGMYNDDKIDAIEIAKIGQYAENVYFGKPSGLMDQMACSVGGLIHIDFMDNKNPVVSKVEVEFENFHHNLVIVDTKGSHADLTGEYAAIPTEMKKIAAYFGKEVLREVDEKDFFANVAKLRETAGDRAVLRAFHYFNENKRVDAQKNALENGDFEEFKRLIVESGDSSYKYLQNVYVNGRPEEENLAVALAMTEKIMGADGCWRVHGGGFAGTIQAFLPEDKMEDYAAEIEKIYGEGSCYFLNVRKIGGCRVV